MALLLIAAALAAVPARAHAAPNAFAGLVTEDAFGGTPQYREAVFKRIASAGAGTVRQTLDWAWTEPKRGQQNWAMYDAYVGAAAKRGIQVLPVVFNAPDWASKRPRKHPKRGTYPPRYNSRFAKFAVQAVHRYGPNGTFWAEHPELPAKPVHSWQIWNEPNLPVYWQPQPRASQYVALLKTTAKAIKRADPTAQILSAGLPKSKLGIPLDTFIKQMYASGAAGAMDALAVNPYSPSAEGVLEFLQHIRAIMDDHNDGAGNLWATEIGWSDNGPGGHFRLGSEGQAQAITDAFTLSWQHRDELRLQGVIYFNWRDARPYPGGHDFWGLHTGLLRLNGTTKPAFMALKSAIAALQ